ncbi:L,D-transpeptidase [Rhodobacterales bacterium]|nr:L,D-transpeptidase [Rhodobacterales bacterium]
MQTRLTRRALLFAGGALAVSGCETRSRTSGFAAAGSHLGPETASHRSSEIHYAARIDQGYEIPEVDLHRLAPGLRRSVVPDPTGLKPGTIVIRLDECRLYLVGRDGQAFRYGIGIGADGYRWKGSGMIGRKEKWPTWTPTAEMLIRHPSLAIYRNGQGGGINNPLGARALYIFQRGRDTLYRVHGTPEWWSIGRAMSSGCIRMINQDVIDLYSRVPQGASIVVH